MKKFTIFFYLLLSFRFVAQDYYRENYSEENKIQYEVIENNPNYYLSVTQRYWGDPVFGIVDLKKKDVFPMIFKKVYAFKNGGFLLYDGKKTIRVSSDFKIEKTYEAYIGENNQYFVALGKINTQLPQDVFDQNGNSILSSLGIDKNSSYFVNALSHYNAKNPGLYVINKIDPDGKKSVALFDVVNFKWLTGFKFQKFLEFGAGYIVIDGAIDDMRFDQYRYQGLAHTYINDEYLSQEQAVFDGEYVLKGKTVLILKNAQFVFDQAILMQNKEGKYGVVNSDLKEIIPFEFDLIENSNSMFQRFFLQLKKENNLILFDEFGSKYLENGYTSIDVFWSIGFMVQKNKKFGLVDVNNFEIIPVKYDTLAYCGAFIFGRLNGLWEKMKVFSPKEIKMVENEITNIRFFDNGRCALEKNKKWGFVMENDDKVNYRFEDVAITKDQLLYKKDNKFGILDINGSPQTKAVYDVVEKIDENLYMIYVNGKYGVIQVLKGKKGYEVVKKIIPKFDFIQFNEGYRGYEFLLFDRELGTSKKEFIELHNRYEDEGY